MDALLPEPTLRFRRKAINELKNSNAGANRFVCGQHVAAMHFMFTKPVIQDFEKLLAFLANKKFKGGKGLGR